MTSETIADTQPYWDQYYAASFTFGWGTEDILTMLAGLPPAAVWLDLGAGSESLLWSIPLNAGQLLQLSRSAPPPPPPGHRRWCAAPPAGVRLTSRSSRSRKKRARHLLTVWRLTPSRDRQIAATLSAGQHDPRPAPVGATVRSGWFLIPIRRGLSSVWARSVEGTPARREYANLGHIEPIHENGGWALRVGQGLLVLGRHLAGLLFRVIAVLRRHTAPETGAESVLTPSHSSSHLQLFNSRCPGG